MREAIKEVIEEIPHSQYLTKGDYKRILGLTTSAILALIEKEHAGLARENKDLHNCVSRCWKALGISDYTGKSVSEHIEQLRAKLNQFEKRCDGIEAIVLDKVGGDAQGDYDGCIKAIKEYLLVKSKEKPKC